MSEPIVGESYDDYPYPSLSYALTHPDRLATLATLFGLSPAPVEKCRYLDIGCAVGGNLFPMAYTLPGSDFTGIDYAGRQIEIGRMHQADLGLTNVRMEQMDILDVPEDFGQFDYIIAHGIYSWVPDNVRDTLMAVIKRHLAPNGIAYISYNVYPGWHMVGMVRGMMKYRIRDIEDPSEKATKAKELLDLMVSADYEGNPAFGNFLNTYHRSLTGKLEQGDDQGISLLLHDELSEINHPVYFHEFVEHAGKHRLQYLNEVELYQVSPARYPKEIVRELGQMAGDPVDFEQYLDFLQNRTFRKSLLCHAEVTVTRRLRPESVYGLYLSSNAKPVAEEPDVKGPTIEQFKAKDGSTFSTDHPLSKATFVTLSKNVPSILPFDELATTGAERLGISPGEKLAKETMVLAANMLQAYSYNDALIQIHGHAPSFVTHISKRPLANPIARWQATRFGRVTNMRHERVALDRLSRTLLSHLDGEHDRQDLLKVVLNLHKEGKIVLTTEENRDISAKSLRKLIRKDIAQNLQFFAWAALLIG